MKRITMITVTRWKGSHWHVCTFWGGIAPRDYKFITDASLARIEKVATYKNTRRYDTKNTCGRVVSHQIETVYTF